MAVGDAHVFPGFLTSVLTQLSFQSQPLLFSLAVKKVGLDRNPLALWQDIVTMVCIVVCLISDKNQFRITWVALVNIRTTT